MIGIGFGCFHFSPVVSVGERFAASGYPDAVTRALEGIAGSANVFVDSYPEMFDWETILDSPCPQLHEDDGPFPDPEWLHVEFDVQIPRHVQEELLRSPGLGAWGINTEDFHVEIRHGMDMPVAAVVLPDLGKDSSPARAINLVRSFLEREFNESPNARVRFEWLGPSPAHVECFLEPTVRPPSVRRNFWLLEHRAPDYLEYRYGFDRQDFETEDAAISNFLIDVTQEMALYYRLVREERFRLAAWDRIDQAVVDLMALQERRGIRGSARRTLLSSRRIAAGQLALLDFQSRETTRGRELERRVAALRRDPSPRFALELLESELCDRTTYPTRETAELLNLLDARRASDRDVLMLGLASVLGGALGAVGGLLAG